MAVPVILPSISPLLEALERNLCGHVAYVQRCTPGMAVKDDEDLLLVDCGLQTDTFNKVAGARLTESTADRRIEEAIAWFRTAERPFAWWVGPASRPVDLDRRLWDHGLHSVETELGMAMDLGALPTEVERVSGLEVRRVRTRDELDDFASINAASWDPPDGNVISFYRAGAPVLLHEDCPMLLYNGYLDGHAVATSELFLGGGVGGVYGVATRLAYRRRGIGAVMTWYACAEARRLGMETAVLQAAEEGKGVYTRLGFRPCCYFAEYQ